MTSDGARRRPKRWTLWANAAAAACRTSSGCTARLAKSSKSRLRRMRSQPSHHRRGMRRRRPDDTARVRSMRFIPSHVENFRRRSVAISASQSRAAAASCNRSIGGMRWSPASCLPSPRDLHLRRPRQAAFGGGCLAASSSSGEQGRAVLGPINHKHVRLRRESLRLN